MADNSSKTTTDHDTIRKWVEDRDGRPTQVRDSGTKEDPGILRIDFDYGEPDKSLEEVSWDKFFETFEENHLAFLYQEKTDEGKKSRFFKFVARDKKGK